MKKLLVCFTVAAFATMTSLQAGECTKEKSACPAQAKTSCSSAQTASKSCCSAGKVAKKSVKTSSKGGATVLVQR